MPGLPASGTDEGTFIRICPVTGEDPGEHSASASCSDY